MTHYTRIRKTELGTVSGAQFPWLVLQDVLPKGFRRARNFDFLHSNCKRLITLLHILAQMPATASEGRAQATPAHRLPVLRGGDEDRADALAAPASANCHSGWLLIM